MRNNTFSTFDIAKLLELSPGTVANWVDGGRLKAFTTLGGHRRVVREDLLAFLNGNKMPVPAVLEPAGPPRILVVDDDVSFLRLLVRGLKFRGYEASTAADGFQAGLAVQSRQPALVILDIILPGIDGFEVCKTIKAARRGTFIIAVTGHDSEDTRKKILTAGADEYLVKPFELKTLFGKIERLLGKAAAARPPE